MPFEKGTGGRPKGAANKSTILVKTAFAEAFDELQKDPEVKLSAWGKENPTEFYKLASKLIPVQIDAAVNQNVNLLNIDPLANIDDTSYNGDTEDSGA